MIKIYFIGIFTSMLVLSGLSQTPDTPPPAIYTVVDQIPEFPGGQSEMFKYTKKNLVYPKTAIDKKLEGKCTIKFAVGSTGKIYDVKVLKGVPGCAECDQEAIRVVSTMPDWKPAMLNGKAVDAYFNLPFNFKL